MLQIYNTLTKQKQEFTPLTQGKIKMYVCGVTVYDLCHIGHARVMVAFDVISRYLRYRGWELEYVRNITDVDDKIIRRAAENNETPQELTERMIAAMHQDEAALFVLPPDREPRATKHIEDIINLIKILEEKGFAYLADNGDVFYRVSRFTDYGKLTNKQTDELQSGVRVAVEQAKESPLDFVLWKAAKAGEISWESPWGNGRPGWHIECSAMSKHCLGSSFDIHGGGPDLPFPHHENEIAQSEAANGCTYAHTWMHAGAVRVNAEKMSKSLGNFFTIRQVLEQYEPEVVRFFLARVHYRSAIDYSNDSLKEAQNMLKRFYQALEGVQSIQELSAPNNEFGQRFIAAMDDDFNTPKAISVLFELVNNLNKAVRANQLTEAATLAAQLRQLGGILGLLQQDATKFLQGNEQQGCKLSHADIEQLIVERAQAKKNKDFATADRIRTELSEQGILLKDSREGTSWYKLTAK